MARAGASGGGGRFAVYGVAGALASAVPLPIVPRRILRALRAAMAHDVCARRGIALTPDARELLAEPVLGKKGRRRGSIARDALAYVASRAMRRLGPLGVFYAPVRDGWETLAFGRLFDRYLELHRPTAVRRIDGDEAQLVRRWLDRASERAFDLALQDREGGEQLDAPEDYRGLVEKTLDGVIIGIAKLPEVLARRLDASLDDIVRTERGGGA